MFHGIYSDEIREKRADELCGEKTRSSWKLKSIRVQGHMMVVGWLSHRRCINHCVLSSLLLRSDTMSTNFSPTPAELTLVSQIFAQADPQKLGVLTGDVAVRVFGGAKLPPTTLGEIWNLSDEDNKGWLPKKGVAIAVRLIGWAQKGEKITQALANKRMS